MQIPKRTYYKILKIVKDQEFIIRLQERYIDLIDEYGCYYFNLCIQMMKDNSELRDVAEHNAKQYYEVTRAYNALASLGKMAKDLGIDIEKHRKELPENKFKDYEFTAGQRVNESGKVVTIIKASPPKKEKRKRKNNVS